MRQDHLRGRSTKGIVRSLRGRLHDAKEGGAPWVPLNGLCQPGTLPLERIGRDGPPPDRHAEGASLRHCNRFVTPNHANDVGSISKRRVHRFPEGRGVASIHDLRSGVLRKRSPPSRAPCRRSEPERWRSGEANRANSWDRWFVTMRRRRPRCRLVQPGRRGRGRRRSNAPGDGTRTAGASDAASIQYLLRCQGYVGSGTR